MTQRWRDRIVVMRKKSGESDVWGYSTFPTYEEIGTYWADVRPTLGVKRSALVKVKDPFPEEGEVQILWKGQRWRVTHPLVFNEHTGLGQFKMEEVHA